MVGSSIRSRCSLKMGALLLAVMLPWATPALAEDEPSQPAAAKAKPAANERIWRGFLWKDADGHVRMGWPVISMGVISQPGHVIAFPDVERVRPLITVGADAFVFWNYTLEQPFAKGLPKLPKVLVQVRGPVTVTGMDTKHGWSSGQGTHTMKAPRILSIEFVSDAWLKAWAPIFREQDSPWHIHDRGVRDAAVVARTLAPKFLAVVRALRQVPGPTAEQRALAAILAPNAEVTRSFRMRQELDILRWVHLMNDTHELKLKGLAELGEVPPTGMVLRRLFVASADRATFLKAVRAAWKGPLAPLELPYYLANTRGGVTWASVRVDVVSSTWTDAAYLAHRAVTRKTLKR